MQSVPCGSVPPLSQEIDFQASPAFKESEYSLIIKLMKQCVSTSSPVPSTSTTVPCTSNTPEDENTLSKEFAESVTEQQVAPHSKNSVSKERANGNLRLYRAFRTICLFSQPEDLFQLQKKDFLRLCEVTHIHWKLKGPLFKDNPVLINGAIPSATNAEGEAADKVAVDSSTSSPSSKSGTLSHRFEVDLTCKGRMYGQMIFISSGKILRRQKSFLSRVGNMIASSLSFMEDTKRLEISKDQWDLVFDSFYRALCITDDKFQMLRTNKAFRQLTGRKKTEIAGKNVFSVFPIPVSPPLSHQKKATWISSSPSGHPPLSLEFSMKTVFLTNERLTVRLLLVKDVTEEIKMERQISSQARSRELGLIKSSMAHELNNPIAGIKALLTVIESGLSDTSEKHLLGDMHSAVNRCQEIITRLLSAASHNSEAVKMTDLDEGGSLRNGTDD